MIAPLPLRERPLIPGRGRVYQYESYWSADYRFPDGTVYGAWTDTLPEAHDWIQRIAK